MTRDLNQADTGTATSALLGLAVADALGAPLEFSSCEEATAAVEAGLELSGGRGWEPGEWTDDTAMALCLAECIGDRGMPIDLDDLTRRYVDWASSRPKDIGITTRRALAGAENADQARDNARALHEQSGRTAGNGTVMRAAPLAFAPAPREDILLAARNDARLTHWDDVAGDASAALCSALLALRSGEDPIVAAIEESGQHPKLSAALQQVADGDLDEVGRLAGGPEGGTCWATLAAGLAALSFDSYDTGVSWAISHGFDTDTNAAVAGALLACRDGASAIPRRWLDGLRDGHRIEAAGRKLDGDGGD